MKLKNPPPKNARLTKKFANEVLAVLREFEYRIFIPRILDRPANGIEWEWLRDIQERVTAIRAHLHSWREGEKRKARKRKKNAMEANSKQKMRETADWLNQLVNLINGEIARYMSQGVDCFSVDCGPWHIQYDKAQGECNGSK